MFSPLVQIFCISFLFTVRRIRRLIAAINCSLNCDNNLGKSNRHFETKIAPPKKQLNHSQEFNKNETKKRKNAIWPKLQAVSALEIPWDLKRRDERGADNMQVLNCKKTWIFINKIPLYLRTEGGSVEEGRNKQPTKNPQQKPNPLKSTILVKELRRRQSSTIIDVFYSANKTTNIVPFVCAVFRRICKLYLQTIFYVNVTQ